jgi:hypothetical protein
LYPAELNVELASLYFWPTTFGEAPAAAIPAPAGPATASATTTAAASQEPLLLASINVTNRL